MKACLPIAFHFLHRIAKTRLAIIAMPGMTRRPGLTLRQASSGGRSKRAITDDQRAPAHSFPTGFAEENS